MRFWRILALAIVIVLGVIFSHALDGNVAWSAFVLYVNSTLPPPPQTLTTAPKLGPNPTLLSNCSIFFAIISGPTPKCRELRHAQRETWLRRSETNRPCYRFFLGNPTVELQQENEEFKDLVFLPLEDFYHNLANKTLKMMAWSSRNVPFSLLVKTDDDTYIVLGRLLQLLSPHVSHNGVWLGNANAWWLPHRQGKWAVTYEAYPHSRGPPWTNGFLYVASSDAVSYYAQKLNNSSWPRLHLEDIDFALAMEEIRVVPSQLPGILGEGCGELMTATHYQSPDAMRAYFSREQRSQPLCSS